MERILKVGVSAAAVVLYVWFAAVKNAQSVQERKRARLRFDDRRSLH
jgi:hypothetical protein